MTLAMKHIVLHTYQLVSAPFLTTTTERGRLSRFEPFNVVFQDKNVGERSIHSPNNQPEDKMTIIFCRCPLSPICHQCMSTWYNVRSVLYIYNGITLTRIENKSIVLDKWYTIYFAFIFNLRGIFYKPYQITGTYYQ